jgi:hypothetical protein
MQALYAVCVRQLAFGAKINSRDERTNTKNALNVSQNSFLIDASQKVYGRLSLEKTIHATEKGEKRSGGRAERTRTPRRA